MAAGIAQEQANEVESLVTSCPRVKFARWWSSDDLESRPGIHFAATARRLFVRQTMPISFFERVRVSIDKCQPHEAVPSIPPVRNRDGLGVGLRCVYA